MLLAPARSQSNWGKVDRQARKCMQFRVARNFFVRVQEILRENLTSELGREGRVGPASLACSVCCSCLPGLTPPFSRAAPQFSLKTSLIP